MSQLAEYLKTTGKEISAKVRENKPLLDEWRRDVEQFLQTVQSAVEAADTEQVLFLRRSRVLLREVRFGEYELPSLEIVLGDTEVRVEPRARFHMGRLKDPQDGTEFQVEGRIDITDGVRRYLAYRVPVLEKGHGWWICDEDRKRVRFGRDEVIQDVILDLLK
jgi:hypothetical protein